MFTSLTQTSLSVLTLSAQQHSILNAVMIDEIVTMMTREKWTCHCCGVKLPYMMEVDHLKGHSPSGKHAIMPICQFCHDRKHPIWAASRNRLAVVHAPDFTQEELTQLCWVMLLHAGDASMSFDMKKLKRELAARREDAVDALGHDNMEATLEAMQSYMDSKGVDEMIPVLQEIDTQIKVVPNLIFEDDPKIFSWSNGGFMEIDKSWREHAKPDLPDPDTIRSAGEALKLKL